MYQRPKTRLKLPSIHSNGKWRNVFFKSVEAFILACILNRDTPGHITRELQEAAEDWNMGGYQSARGPKRRKLNAVDGELDDRDIEPFLAQIVAILKYCWMSMS